MLLFDDQRVGEDVDEPLRETFGVCISVDTGLEHQKLVAADACQRVAPAERAEKTSRDDPQRFIARRVAKAPTS